MKPLILTGSGNPALGASIARELGVELETCTTERFPDDEIAAHVPADLTGRRVFVVQSIARPPSDRLLELLCISDASRRSGASSVSAIIPYMGYARQERRTRRGDSLGMRVVADLLAAGRFDRVIAVDLHAPAVEGFFECPLEHVSAVPILAQRVASYATKDSVVVAPDLGAVRLARQYAEILELPLAVIHKTRLSPVEVSVEHVIGDVRGRHPIIVDDMISTGGTIAAASQALMQSGAVPEMTVVATHAVLVELSFARLAAAHVRRLIASDSLPAPHGLPFELDLVELAPLLADAIRNAWSL